jgi:hypothetical protein
MHVVLQELRLSASALTHHVDDPGLLHQVVVPAHRQEGGAVMQRRVDVAEAAHEKRTKTPGQLLTV